MRSDSHRRVLLVGGSSEIGLAIVRRLAMDGQVQPYLLGRDHARTADALAELERSRIAGEIGPLDLDDTNRVAEAIGTVFEESGGFELVVLAVGVLGAQDGLDADPTVAAEVMRVNFFGCGLVLLECMRRMRKNGSGTIVVLSSVAAERPRASNAIYGAAKAGLDALAQGLADSTAEHGPRVLVVRPGFVRTRMTAGLSPAPFATSAEAVADATVRALAGNANTIWVPGKLRLIFALLRLVPRRLYRKLPL
jgi:decaprenylphospho-beta-D-erythro-pentofuranosid-2-ulose 2-reductase